MDAAAAIRRSAETPGRATKADLPQVAQDLADAFGDDPHFDWFMRADVRRKAERERFFNFVVTTMARPGRIDRPVGGGAAAVWMPSETLTKPTLREELRTLPAMLRATGLARFGRLIEVRNTMDAHHPMDRRHLYLWFLGVTPRLQGMGIGSRLLRAGLNRADEAGLPAYLETGTERNVALYRRHGFQIIHQGPPGKGAPTMWHMWREPAGG